jgi:hypothetical protein
LKRIWLVASSNDWYKASKYSWLLAINYDLKEN